MAKKLDQLIIIDLESTCWEGNPPEGQVSEIIEIGICTLDMKTQEVGTPEGIFVLPVKSEISSFCTQLTSISPEMIAQEGIDLAEACQILKKKYKSKERVWVSWGDYDRRQFEKNCGFRNIAYPFGATHLNAKTWFALRHQLSHELGMAEALQHANLPLKGTHHRGVDDAYNIAMLLKSVLF